MHYSCSFLLCGVLLTASVAQAETADDATKLKQQIVGGGLAIGYGIDHCDMPTTPSQRDQFKAKLTDLKHQVGMDGELSQAQLKDIIGLKSAEDEKMFCTGLQMTFPNMLAGFLAEKPPSEWGKGAAATTPGETAKAGDAKAPAPATVGDWEVAPVPGAPGICQIAHGYKDKDDDNAENVIILRQANAGYILALTYAKWDWTAGEKMSAALTTPDDIVSDKADWTADTTGKVLTTTLAADAKDALKKAETMSIKFPDGDAEFDVPKIGDAIAAMETCAKGK